MRFLGTRSARITRWVCIRVESQCVAVKRAAEFRGESPATSRRSRDSPTDSFPDFAPSHRALRSPVPPSFAVVHFLARTQTDSRHNRRVSVNLHPGGCYGSPARQSPLPRSTIIIIFVRQELKKVITKVGDTFDICSHPYSLDNGDSFSIYFFYLYGIFCTLPPRVLDRRSPAHRSPPPLQTKQTLVGKRKHLRWSAPAAVVSPFRASL